jgi:hypothetical protein
MFFLTTNNFLSIRFGVPELRFYARDLSDVTNVTGKPILIITFINNFHTPSFQILAQTVLKFPENYLCGVSYGEKRIIAGRAWKLSSL